MIHYLHERIYSRMLIIFLLYTLVYQRSINYNIKKTYDKCKYITDKFTNDYIIYNYGKTI